MHFASRTRGGAQGWTGVGPFGNDKRFGENRLLVVAGKKSGRV